MTATGMPIREDWHPFKPRAKAMLDDPQSLIKDIEASGKKVMLIVVPEHGAAERGDKVPR